MKIIQDFLLEPLSEKQLRSHLTLKNGPTLEVEGRVLETQFQCSQGYLVITSDGNPYEEMLHLYLLNDKCEVLDGVSLGQIYHSGSIRDVTVCGDDCLEFSFFGTERWRLHILNIPEIRLLPRPLASVRYLKGWLHSHYLRLKKVH